MRHFILAAVAAPLLALPALAQTTPPMNTTGSSAQTGTQAAAGGMAGSNSFTEGQARSRLEKDGYTNVSGLAKDKDGVWRGRASKGSDEHNVGVDYKGNIITN